MQTATKTAEAALLKYFKDIRAVKIWRANAERLQERRQRLEGMINRGIPVIFTDGVKSQQFYAAKPANNQPPSSLDSVIERAAKEEDKLIQEHASIEIDIMIIENNIERLERSTLTTTDILNQLDSEARQALELKLSQNKSYDEIGERLRKSKSAAYRLYGEALKTVHSWLTITTLQS